MVFLGCFGLVFWISGLGGWVCGSVDGFVGLDLGLVVIWFLWVGVI